MDLWAPLPDWRWESLMMRGVGTISWFLLPCSTCFELHRLGLWIFLIGCCWEGVVSGTYGGEDAPVFGG